MEPPGAGKRAEAGSDPRAGLECASDLWPEPWEKCSKNNVLDNPEEGLQLETVPGRELWKPSEICSGPAAELGRGTGAGEAAGIGAAGSGNLGKGPESHQKYKA